MEPTRLIAPSPVDLLKRDHDRIRILFKKRAQAPVEAAELRRSIFRELRSALLLHGELERDYVYPALPEGTASIREDHAEIQGLIDALSIRAGGGRSADALVRLLEEAFTMHAAIEERDYHPRLQKLTDFARYELTLRLENVRAELQRRRDYGLPFESPGRRATFVQPSSRESKCR